MLPSYLEQIKFLRLHTGAPIWAIAACLKLNNFSTVKALDELVELYSVFGDHPDIVVKQNEEKLRKRLKEAGNK